MIFILLYKAQNLMGEKIKGLYYKNDIVQLRQELRQKDFYITNVNTSSIFDKFTVNKKMKYKDGWIFSSELNILIQSGVKLTNAIDILKDYFKSYTIKYSLSSIVNDLYQGKSLYYSMSKYEDIYDKFLIEMINIGECSGRLEYVLEKTANYYKNRYKIQQKIRKAMLYPKFIFSVFIIMCVIIFNFIIPEVMKLLNSFSIKISPFIRVSYTFFNVLKENILFTMIIGIVLMFSINCLKRKKREVFIAIILKISWIRKKYITYKMIDVFYSISIMMESGINLITCLKNCSEIISNSKVNEIIINILNSLKNGKTFFEAIAKENFIDKKCLTIIKIGEETANLDRSLKKISDIYEENLLQNINKATKFIEPMIIIVISILIGALIISLVIPMLNVMDTIV